MFKKIVGLGFSSKGKNKKDVSEYIQKLVEAGATEFFTGYNPPYWYEKYGFEVSPNGRFAEHEQITDFETLKQIVEEVHKHGFELFINLNAWYYTDETFPLIQQMLEEFQTLDIDGIICGNVSILEYLKQIGYKGKINISTIMALYNSQAVAFFLENYDINKIILSREVTLKEIENLVNRFPETKFEVFGEGDFCRYNNGLCFAEHKYGARDICTVVVNDLIIKKKYRADFKKIILDDSISNEQKLKKMNDSYQTIFEQIEDILTELQLGISDEQELIKNLEFLIKKAKNRVDLFFDAMQPINSQHNKNIFSYLKGLKYLIEKMEQIPLLTKEGLGEVKKLEQEISHSVKTGMKYLMEKTKKLGGAEVLKSKELASFYAKGDTLNLYSYLFFSQFKNIETVKFPTRGRSYNEKLKIIEETIENKKVDEKYIDRGASLERAHYDLQYLFGDKLWFREMMKNSI
ncbi:U32 family peptidase [Candidatus Gracilibacteria bacterium]|nr:U32 family peptidase [Candidatus Gracilibacteria bacterium]